MLDFLKNYTGHIKFNDVEISPDDISKNLNNTYGDINIELIPMIDVTAPDRREVKNNPDAYFEVFVKSWMLEKSTRDFQFMTTWNKDIPMPLRFMKGYMTQETRGMIYMDLHGVPIKTTVCSRCGRVLNNPNSKLFGIGPECMDKLGLSKDIYVSDDLAKDMLNKTYEYIKNIKWSGWIPKNAILEMKKCDE